MAADAAEDHGAAQHGDLAQLATQPVEYGGVLGLGDLPGPQLGLAQPQHGDAELLDHGVVVEHVVLQLAVDVAAELGGGDVVVGGDRVDRQIGRPIGDRVGEGRKRCPDAVTGERLPVDLAGDGEEDLVHHVDAGVDGVDAGGRVAAISRPQAQ